MKSNYIIDTILKGLGIMFIVAVIALLVWNIPFFSSIEYKFSHEHAYSFIGICATFVVGFQIYNRIEISEKLKELEIKLSELNSEKERLHNALRDIEYNRERLVNESMYYSAYNIGQQRYMQTERTKAGQPILYAWNALRAFNNALKYAYLGGHSFSESYKAIKPKITECIKIIKSNSSTHNDKYKVIIDINNAFYKIKEKKLENEEEERYRLEYIEFMNTNWMNYSNSIVSKLFDYNSTPPQTPPIPYY
ncbi:MAG: hypothetical protein IJY31_06085 [Muribaculaceae bacterium]|nr:hypothetical protein [Muribaculaceae bacterium]